MSGMKADGHVTTGDRNVARHRVEVSDDDRDSVDGIPCTNLARTVADFTRIASVEAGLAVADAALRRIAWDEREHRYDAGSAAAFVAQAAECIARAGRGRGVKRARRVLGLADGRAQLPGESVSRLYLLQLGFAPPRLQVPIQAPAGAGFYYVDFGLDDVEAWGEFDGTAKYVLPELRRGSDAEDVVIAEKMREDWIRGTTHRRFPRWGSEHIRSAAVLGERLAQFHVFAPGGAAVRAPA